MFVPIEVDGFTLNKRAKFSLCVNSEKQFCINAQHVSAVMKELGHEISTCDVYNYCCPERRSKSLKRRWPDNIVATKLNEDVRRLKRRIEMGDENVQK